MARIVLPGDMAQRFAGGEKEIEVAAGSVRHLISFLDKKFPGIGEVLSSSATAVAIDGNIYQNALFETYEEDAEVVFLPAIRGG